MSASSATDDWTPIDRPATVRQADESPDVAASSERLSRSRERLRRALHPPPDDTAASQARTSPEHAVLGVAQAAARRGLEAMADQHPLPLIAMAAAAGGLIALGRPWRGLLRPALIAGIATRLITRVPAEHAFSLLAAMFNSSKRNSARRGNGAR